MASLTLAKAEALLTAALAEARRLGLGKMGVVVTDPSGEMIAARREDGGGALAITIALGKARTALAFSMTSQAITEILSGNPAAIPSLSATLGGRLLFLGGGVPIHDADGKPIGAIAASGDAPHMDEAICTHAIVAH
jgi:uncharacterized protein GlcG (DUF336 family)